MDKELDLNQFVDAMIIKEKNEQVKFKIQEKDNIVKEIIMLVVSDGEVVVMNISGNIDLTKVDLITESIDIKKVKGKQYFESTPNNDKISDKHWGFNKVRFIEFPLMDIQDDNDIKEKIFKGFDKIGEWEEK